MQLLPVTLLLALLSGCLASQPAREYLDNDTAATITVGNQSWVFARERPDLAVHAQDYITMTPLQVNRGGKRTIYLYCQLWSTIDRRGDKAIVPAAAELALIADDRRIVLSVVDGQKMGLGQSPVDVPSRYTELRAAIVSPELLQFLVHANQVRIAVKIDGVTDYFSTWRSGQNALLPFLQQVAQ